MSTDVPLVLFSSAAYQSQAHADGQMRSSKCRYTAAAAGIPNRECSKELARRVRLLHRRCLMVKPLCRNTLKL